MGPMTTNSVRMQPGIFDGSQAESVRYPADEVLLRVTGAGNVQVAEYVSEDREGPPPHRHEWDEVEYVIEGTVEFWIGEGWVRGGPGTVQMLPAGVPHSVRVPEGRARVLMITIGRPYEASPGSCRGSSRAAQIPPTASSAWPRDTAFGSA